MKKNNLYLIGFMGTGKSPIGRIIARNRSEMIFCEMDDMIEKHEGKTISDIFAELGEAYFRQVETDVLKEIADMDNAIVSCGGGVPLKDENIEIMKQSGITRRMLPLLRMQMHRKSPRALEPASPMSIVLGSAFFQR